MILCITHLLRGRRGVHAAQRHSRLDRVFTLRRVHSDTALVLLCLHDIHCVDIIVCARYYLLCMYCREAGRYMECNITIVQIVKLHFVDVIVKLCTWYYCVDMLLLIINLPQGSWELHGGQHHSSLDCVITFRRCCCDAVYVILLCLHAVICYLFAAGKQGITWIETTQ